MQRNTLLEGCEKGHDVGKALHFRDDFGRRVWKRAMETTWGGEVRLRMWKFGGKMHSPTCTGCPCRNRGEDVRKEETLTEFFQLASKIIPSG